MAWHGPEAKPSHRKPATSKAQANTDPWTRTPGEQRRRSFIRHRLPRGFIPLASRLRPCLVHSRTVEGWNHGDGMDAQSISMPIICSTGRIVVATRQSPLGPCISVLSFPVLGRPSCTPAAAAGSHRRSRRFRGCLFVSSQEPDASGRCCCYGVGRLHNASITERGWRRLGGLFGTAPASQSWIHDATSTPLARYIWVLGTFSFLFLSPSSGQSCQTCVRVWALTLSHPR